MGGGSFMGFGHFPFFGPVFMIVVWAATLLVAGLVFKWAVDLFVPDRQPVRYEREREDHKR